VLGTGIFNIFKDLHIFGESLEDHTPIPKFGYANKGCFKENKKSEQHSTKAHVDLLT